MVDKMTWTVLDWNRFFLAKIERPSSQNSGGDKFAPSSRSVAASQVFYVMGLHIRLGPVGLRDGLAFLPENLTSNLR